MEIQKRPTIPTIALCVILKDWGRGVLSERLVELLKKRA